MFDPTELLDPVTNPPTKNAVLLGLVGSKAYGLDHAGSDNDHLGIYQAPTRDLLGLAGVEQTRHIVGTTDDYTLHELGKFCRLALNANPTVLEMLWLDHYEIREDVGEELIRMREAFLSNRVRNSYGGYARQQFNKLLKRGDFGSDLAKRTEKHARHLFRLLIQGRHLLETGEIRVRLDNPDEVRSWSMLPVDQLAAVAEDLFREFDATVSVLPDEPNTEAVNRFLVDARMAPRQTGSWVAE